MTMTTTCTHPPGRFSAYRVVRGGDCELAQGRCRVCGGWFSIETTAQGDTEVRALTPKEIADFQNDPYAIENARPTWTPDGHTMLALNGRDGSVRMLGTAEEDDAIRAAHVNEMFVQPGRRQAQANRRRSCEVSNATAPAVPDQPARARKGESQGETNG